MRKPANIGASVRARLLNLARDRNQPFQLLLTRYVLERWLYRLTQTRHRDRFVLKGAMLMTTWFNDPFRPTQDLDLLGFGNDDVAAVAKSIAHICKQTVPGDGLIFDTTSIKAEGSQPARDHSPQVFRWQGGADLEPLDDDASFRAMVTSLDIA